MRRAAFLIALLAVPVAATAQTTPPAPIATVTPFVQPSAPTGVRPVIVIDPRVLASPTPVARATPRRRVPARPAPRKTRDPYAVASPEVFERTTTGTPPPR